MPLQTFRRLSGSAPEGAMVIRLVRAGSDIVGFITEIDEPGDDSAYPSEQTPLDHIWRLVESKRESMPDAVIYVELEADIDWRPEWGELV